jgi:integrase
MAKKGENIYKRKDNRWEGRYIKGRRDDGKPVFGYVYGQKYKNVKAELKLLKRKQEEEETASDVRAVTFSEFADEWLVDPARAALKPSTLAFYNTLINVYLLPVFETRELNSLKREDIRAFVDSLAQKGISASSTRNIVGLLNRMMKAAIIGNMLRHNPCTGVALPKRDTSAVPAMRLHEQKKLEKAALADKDGLAVIIALYTGMRIGEICALRWDDVELENGLLHVRHTVQRVAADAERCDGKTRLVFGTPKSLHSRRSIPLTTSLKRRLENEKLAQTCEFVVSGYDSFTEPRTVRYRFGRLLKQAGLAPVRFHTLRRTFATRCMETGMDITTLSRLLGHASVKMTLDVYTDSTPERKAAAMGKLDKLLAINN